MARFYKDFRITGVLNTTEWDDGITSTEAERKRCIGVLLNVSGYADNTIQVNIDREKVAGIPDYLLDTESDLGAANFPYSTAKMQFVELDQELELGTTLQVGIVCGGTPYDVRGAYVYELLS